MNNLSEIKLDHKPNTKVGVHKNCGGEIVYKVTSQGSGFNMAMYICERCKLAVEGETIRLYD
jgi:hypothetical protein